MKNIAIPKLFRHLERSEESLSSVVVRGGGPSVFPFLFFVVPAEAGIQVFSSSRYHN